MLVLTPAINFLNSFPSLPLQACIIEAEAGPVPVLPGPAAAAASGCRVSPPEQQRAASVAETPGSANLVNNGELVRIIGREVRGEDAVLGAAASEQLAGSARRSSAHFGVRINLEKLG
ncbi:hypothetical protein U1Q18_033558 [Sarracenia purpurea var. burkii]